MGPHDGSITIRSVTWADEADEALPSELTTATYAKDDEAARTRGRRRYRQRYAPLPFPTAVPPAAQPAWLSACWAVSLCLCLSVPPVTVVWIAIERRKLLLPLPAPAPRAARPCPDADHVPLDDRAAQSFFDLTAIDIRGELHAFEQYRGNVVLAVNVATD